MLSIPLNDNVIFHDKDPYAEPLLVDKTGRILRFALKAGQTVREHTAPHSPVYVVVLKGSGLFSGAGDLEQRCGPGTLLVFEAGEPHAIRADTEDLTFVAFLQVAPGAQ
ncbi:MAG TPA: cupin domain-containing protein [Thermoflexales bacterium]|nr:cupin domain-containing protein [Thermoflexales bacterium]HQX09131.1 cupin domain-containing protein [Thermoflexales bacterium]HQZ52846.1 cupin domain-containing protein [Thermoflexales bacterium]HRA53464.1 cupin domain-containing protein [Thermoflexales bacterium]